jgi:hypothetical protein
MPTVGGVHEYGDGGSYIMSPAKKTLLGQATIINTDVALNHLPGKPLASNPPAYFDWLGWYGLLQAWGAGPDEEALATYQSQFTDKKSALIGAGMVVSGAPKGGGSGSGGGGGGGGGGGTAPDVVPETPTGMSLKAKIGIAALGVAVVGSAAAFFLYKR